MRARAGERWLTPSEVAHESEPSTLIHAARGLLNGTAEFLRSEDDWREAFKDRRQQLLAQDQLGFCQEIIDRLRIVLLALPPMAWSSVDETERANGPLLPL